MISKVFIWPIKYTKLEHTLNTQNSHIQSVYLTYEIYKIGTYIA